MRNKPLQLGFRYLLTFVLLNSIVQISTPVMAQTSQQQIQKQKLRKIPRRPKAPRTRRCGDKTCRGSATPGGTRPKAVCPKVKKKLTAIFANNGQDYTQVTYPTFWFFVPYTAEQINTIKFFFLDEKETKTIYRAAIQLHQAGILKITLPKQPEYKLQTNTTYRWYFEVQCKSPEPRKGPDLVVDGWITRTAHLSNSHLNNTADKSLQIYQTYRDNNLWYDAIHSLASKTSVAPTQQVFSQAWLKLINDLDYQWLAYEPFVDSVATPIH